MRLYLKEGFDKEKYQKEISMFLKKEDDLRKRLVLLVTYMAYVFPKLPYFWGGGHNLTLKEMIGIDKRWGSLEIIKDDGSLEWKKGDKAIYSLDCSGFVSWCLINSGFDISRYIYNKEDYCLNSNEFYKLGKRVSITHKKVIYFISPGDLVWMDGHIGIIININYSCKTILVVHVSSSGKGLNITTISLDNGLIIDDDLGEMPQGEKIMRIGKKYFTDIILMNY